MKKLATLLGVSICLSIMKKPRRITEVPVKTVNNYFIKTGCRGNCHCGNH